jgi:hypothetical protein
MTARCQRLSSQNSMPMLPDADMVGDMAMSPHHVGLGSGYDHADMVMPGPCRHGHARAMPNMVMPGLTRLQKEQEAVLADKSL